MLTEWAPMFFGIGKEVLEDLAAWWPRIGRMQLESR